MATIDLPNLGSLDQGSRRAIEILRDRLQDTEDRATKAHELLAAQPPILTIDEIRDQLSATGSSPLPTAALLNTNPAQTNPVPPPSNMAPAPPDHTGVVQAVLAAQSPPLDEFSSNEQIFRFAQQVVWEIFQLGTDPPDMHVGLLHQAAGDGVFTCAGVPYATFRICYDTGANIKILTGSFTAQWTQEANVPLDEYRPPTDPSSPC